MRFDHHSRGPAFLFLTPPLPTGASSSSSQAHTHGNTATYAHHPNPHHDHQPTRRDLFTKTIALALSGLLLGGRTGSSVITTTTTTTSSFLPSVHAAEPPAAACSIKTEPMSMPQAATFIKENCQGMLQLVRDNPNQKFVYRGEDIHRPTFMRCPPDLLDETTYREKEAAIFFGMMEEAIVASNFKDFPVKPSTGHLATSDVRAASAWGTPVSVWPMTKKVRYAWLRDAKSFWPVSPEIMKGGVGRIKECVKKDMVVDKDFDTAVSLGHEVLLNCGLEDKPGEYGFLVVPIAYERELRARLGLAYD